MPATAVRRILARVDVAFGKGRDQMCKLTKVLIIPSLLTRQQCMEGVVEIVVPLGVKPIAPQPLRPDKLCIVEIAFRNEIHPAADPLCLLMDRGGKLLQERLGRKVQDGVHCIKSQGIDMKFRDPVEGIFDEETLDLIAMRPIEVDGHPHGVRYCSVK